MTVRLATPDDLDAVLRVGHETWWATYVPITGEEFVRDGLARWWTAESTLPAIERGLVFVAEEEGAVVGMTMYGVRDRRADIWKLYVLPEAQGSGLGRALVDAVVSAVAGAADEIVLAWLEGNDDAAAFYRRMGFEETHREPDDDGHPHVWMRKAV
ncbi:MAG: GNAT family N-acetyltransferase [Nocardioides sp.]|uniref:GNAT family N-acetyltransferase n=1 Tax=Nocardioides sp. TaxID=35761 RepID=UPI0039E2ED75